MDIKDIRQKSFLKCPNLLRLRARRAKIPPYLDKNTPLFILQNAVLGKNTPLFILQFFAI